MKGTQGIVPGLRALLSTDLTQKQPSWVRASHRTTTTEGPTHPTCLDGWGSRGSHQLALQIQLSCLGQGPPPSALFSGGQGSPAPARAALGLGIPGSFKSHPAYLYLPQTVMGNPGTQETAGQEVVAEAVESWPGSASEMAQEAHPPLPRPSPAMRAGQKAVLQTPGGERCPSQVT